MLNKVKAALRIAVAIYDDELTAMIAAARADLSLCGINPTRVADNNDPLVTMAIITYCRARFGSPADYDRVKLSYDEQKAQLQTATGYGLEA